MIIYFSPDYSSGTYVNLEDHGGILYDCTVVGVEGLVSLIELHLGIHNEPTTQIERQTQWLKCMRKVMDRGTNVLTQSWSKNALGVSNECLAWRDLLRLAKWTNVMQQPAERFRILAEVDKLFHSPSIGDRILHLLTAIDRNPFESGTTIHVGVATPVALMPILAELLDLLKKYGVEVIYDTDRVIAEPETNLAKVQALLCSGAATDTLRADDSTFEIWEFETANDAYRYMASIPQDDFDLYVLSDGKLLDNTQQMLGQPTSGTTIANSAPQIAQMFLLGMNLFESPLNINNLLAWLQLPLHPIKGELRRALVKAIVDTTGFDNDRYTEAISKYLAELPDDTEREKVESLLDTYDVRPSEQVNMEQLRKFNNSLGTWAAQMSAMDNIDASKRQQLHVVSTLCSTLSTLLSDVDDDEIPYRRLAAAISTLYNGAEFRIYATQAGARYTADCGAIVNDTDRILWGDCYNYSPRHSAYDFLNNDERRHFTEQGCQIQSDNDYNRAAIRRLKMPVLRSRKRCVIVTAKRVAGVDSTQHPVMIQIKEGFKDTLQHVTRKPSLSPFETRDIEHVDNVTQTDCIQVSCPLPMPDHESYTSLDRLIQYPLDYVLEKVAGLYASASTDLKQVRTVKGDVAHKVIETLFVGSADEIIAKIDDEYASTVSQVIEQEGAVLLLPENELECKQYKSELLECLKVLAEIIKANDLTVVGREHEIYTHIGLLAADDPGMKGYIDMVLADDAGRLYIFDFKWTSRRSYYRNLLTQNLSLQLALYRDMLGRDCGQTVEACAYFTMPRHELLTTSTTFQVIDNVVVVTPENTDDIVAKAINSYRYRRDRLQSGLIDNEEGAKLSSLAYTAADTNGADLYPLEKQYDDEERHAHNKFSNYACFKFGILK